jgi:hypothetical protein
MELSANITNGTATTESMIAPMAAFQTCKVMNWHNWNDFKYACNWNHGANGNNMFFMRWDGTFVYECRCDNGLGSYDPWGSHWTWSKTDGIACYTRDGKKWYEIEHQFGSVTCRRDQKNCDTKNGYCASF